MRGGRTAGMAAALTLVLGLAGCGFGGDDGGSDEGDEGPYDPAKVVSEAADVSSMLPGNEQVPGDWGKSVGGASVDNRAEAAGNCSSWAGAGCADVEFSGQTTYASSGNADFRILAFDGRAAARKAYRGVFATSESADGFQAVKSERVGSESRTLTRSGDRADRVTVVRVGTVVARVQTYLTGGRADGAAAEAMQAKRISEVLSGEKPTASLR